MTILYCTADAIGAPTGGGRVTKEELLALQEFSSNRMVATRDVGYSPVMVFNRDNLGSQGDDPWKWDLRAFEMIAGNRSIKLAHFYSGTFSKTVAELKRMGCKVTYTIAAHDRFISRREHENLGLPFPFPHLTNEKIWQRYIEGYRLADVIITPGKVPEKTIRAYGEDFAKKPIRIIPHGCDLPEEIKPFPPNFVLGYMGNFAPDKGTRYLLEAWAKLNYRDGSMLMLAGKDSMNPVCKFYLEKFGGGCLAIKGWINDVADFYNNISCYVQPSATEGFGMEVLEAMAYGRPIICSDGAGAVDLVGRPDGSNGWIVSACNLQDLAEAIAATKRLQSYLPTYGTKARETAKLYCWPNIRNHYQEVWKEVLS